MVTQGNIAIKNHNIKNLQNYTNNPKCSFAQLRALPGVNMCLSQTDCEIAACDVANFSLRNTGPGLWEFDLTSLCYMTKPIHRKLNVENNYY